MKSLGYMKGNKKKMKRSHNVSSNIISQINSRFSSAALPRHVEVVTPISLFPQHSHLKTLYKLV